MIAPDRRHVLGSILAGAMASTASAQLGPDTTHAGVPLLDLVGSNAVSVLDFIPVRHHADIQRQTCRADLAPFINAAIRHVLSLPGGGTLFFPRGAYEVSEIDASNADPAQFATTLRIVGEGRFATSIGPVAHGAILLNAAGRNNMTVQSIQFRAAAHAAQAAIVLCRTAASPNCNNNRFFDVLVSGNYEQAGVVSIAAESTSWISCRFENANADARHRCFVTSNHPGVALLRRQAGGVAIASSNTDNVMIDCEFYAPYAQAAPVVFVGAAGYSMQSCTVMTGDASRSRLVTYRPMDGVFNGAVTWTAPHFEVFGTGNVVHFLDAPTGVSYFRSIGSYGGNYVVGSGTELLSYGRDKVGAQPVLMSSTWTVPGTPWDARDLMFRTFGLSNSAIDFRIGDGVGDIDIAGYAANSRVDAARKTIARLVTDGRR